MAGYVLPSDIADYQSGMALLHQTYARPIYIYQSSTETLIFSSPQNNFLYPNSTNPQNSQVNYIVNSGLYYARIKYADEMKNTLMSNVLGKKEQIGLTIPDAKVRIILDQDTYNVISSATRVTFDSGIFEVQSGPRVHSVIGTQFITLYLKPLN